MASSSIKNTKRNDWRLKYAIVLLRIVLGSIFIFSGFVKAVDPLGTAYKIADYGIAFGWSWLSAWATPLSIALSTIEFVLGVTTLVGIKRKLTPIALLLFMGIMTPLTLYLAIANPISDCGCFGDALKLTNWETFGKNVVLLTFSFTLYRWNGRVEALYADATQSLVILYTLLYCFAIAWIGSTRLPLLDFRPYKTGTDLVEAMTIPEGAERDVYETTLVYSKDGVEQEFTLDNYPAQDTTWHFVTTHNELVKQGYRPPIEELEILDRLGDNVAEEILADTNYTFLLLSHRLNKADDSEIDRVNEAHDYSVEHGYNFYCITASTPDEIRAWKDYTGAEYPYYFMDEVEIKRIARANPSVVLLKNGVIVWKKSSRNLPSESELTAPLDQLTLGKTVPYKGSRRVNTLVLLFVTPLLLLLLFEKTILLILKKREARKQAQEREN